MSGIRRRLPQDGDNESEHGELVSLIERKTGRFYRSQRGVPVDSATERRDAKTLPDPMCIS